ncbi:MAG: phosphoribosylaminoimidazolecarboxamide formyltransferase [Clostridia bacterium]|nr:phosphoribosylaminoimidazolecarboxamide formyltransferase [Clostridia bacterium]MBQ4340944.1 phosphoribosylaminoimidazolecarboxamide formyltransferase [Clostridia bacterium]
MKGQNMKELTLKYGCNPNQKPASLSMNDDRDLPFEVLNGNPGYINFLDAFNSWQLVRELKQALSLPAAASFKHVSPAGAAVGVPLSDVMKKKLFVEQIEDINGSLLACAYARARGADRMSSFGDFIALSDKCDLTTARVIKPEVSDGVIAPDYDPEALELLRTKKGGKYCIIKIDPDYSAPEFESKEVFGVTFTQKRNDAKLDYSVLENIVTENRDLPESAKRDLVVAMITLKYTQSNSVCYAVDGQAVGVGAGQQSRIHCTRLAGDKADNWLLREHEKVLSLPFVDTIGRPDRDNCIDCYISDHADDVLAEGEWQRFFKVRPEPLTKEEKREFLASRTGLALASDAFFPFSDNITRAYRSGVRYIVQAGGSKRDGDVIAECNRLGITMVTNGIRLFHH